MGRGSPTTDSLPRGEDRPPGPSRDAAPRRETRERLLGALGRAGALSRRNPSDVKLKRKVRQSSGDRRDRRGVLPLPVALGPRDPCGEGRVGSGSRLGVVNRPRGGGEQGAETPRRRPGPDGAARRLSRLPRRRRRWRPERDALGPGLSAETLADLGGGAREPGRGTKRKLVTRAPEGPGRPLGGGGVTV